MGERKIACEFSKGLLNKVYGFCLVFCPDSDEQVTEGAIVNSEGPMVTLTF